MNHAGAPSFLRFAVGGHGFNSWASTGGIDGFEDPKHGPFVWSPSPESLQTQNPTEKRKKRVAAQIRGPFFKPKKNSLV